MEPLAHKADIVSGDRLVAELFRHDRLRDREGRSAFAENRSRAGLRVVDIVLTLILLAVMAPLLALIVTSYILDPGPILFAHRRIGRDGREFPCFKFRTMVVDADRRLEALLLSCPVSRLEWEQARKLRADPRVTRLGKFLRRSSLDELPQLLNVLRGEMSLVGPRPITRDEVGRYGRFFPVYCRVRPGMTGLWQISGRNDVSYRRRVALDVAFARSSKPFVLYFGIMLRTPICVIRSSGCY